MTEDYTVKKITDVAETTTADTLFIKSGGDIKQISMANLLTQIYPDIELAALKKQMPIGYTFVWSQTSGSGIDLSTAEKVAEYYGFGTWEQIKDRFLLGAGDNYEAGGTGGEVTHLLTKDELPNIHGTLPHIAKGEKKTSGVFKYVTSSETGVENANEGSQSNTINTAHYTLDLGKDTPHNNMPPYLTVYIWRRIA